MIDKTISGITDTAMSAMIHKTAFEKLSDPHIDQDVDHLAEAIRYTFHSAFMQLPKQRSYACECKHCEIILYTSTKRLNCEYCGSSDPGVFTCTELEE